MEFILYLALATFVVSWVLELVFASTWRACYWQNGLIVFHRTFRIAPNRITLSASQLETTQPFSCYQTLLFRPLGANSVVFRESFSFHAGPVYTPAMHGMLLLRTVDGIDVLEVRGMLNWAPLGLIASILILALAMPFFWLLVLVFLATYVYVYVIQAKRFQGLLDAIVS